MSALSYGTRSRRDLLRIWESTITRKGITHAGISQHGRAASTELNQDNPDPECNTSPRTNSVEYNLGDRVSSSRGESLAQITSAESTCDVQHQTNDLNVSVMSIAELECTYARNYDCLCDCHWSSNCCILGLLGNMCCSIYVILVLRVCRNSSLLWEIHTIVSHSPRHAQKANQETKAF